jgi:hypothetical protein
MGTVKLLHICTQEDGLLQYPQLYLNQVRPELLVETHQGWRAVATPSHIHLHARREGQRIGVIADLRVGLWFGNELVAASDPAVASAEAHH